MQFKHPPNVAINLSKMIILLSLLTLSGASIAETKVHRICSNSGCSLTDPATGTPADISQDKDVTVDYDIWRGEDLVELEEKSNNGDSSALYKLGQVYLYGLLGIKADPTKASKMFEQAANLGHPWAMFRLAEMYRLGKGVPANLVRSRELTFIAAKKGLPNAAYNVGHMYYEGIGAPKNESEATYWYEIAASGGVNPAKYALAIIYLKGYEVNSQSNLYEGFNNLKAAAVSGIPDAQFMLANIYLTGMNSLPQDITSAKYWFDAAAKSGNKKAAAKLKEVEKLEKEQQAYQEQLRQKSEETSNLLLGAFTGALLNSFFSPPEPILIYR